MGKTALKKLPFPSDIVASYQVRLLLYGALDVFVPSSRTKIKAFSLAIDGAGDVLEIARAKLEERGWEVRGAKAEDRDILVAEGEGALLGLVVTEAEDAVVLTILISSKDEGVLRDVEERVKSVLSETFQGAEEVMFKSGDGGGLRG